ncbi:fimbrial protein [Citrobacter koseri]|uniref:fimbrial protein n=1 Tax=Citrobacter koseri TaxID=545 RepID=UPI000A78D635|nr:fimbrial protein [Citrobacter koseri]
MMKAVGLFYLLPFYLVTQLSSCYVLASTITPGELAISGELIEAACSIDPAYRNILVEFGDIPASAIDGETSHPFSIRLIGCPITEYPENHSQYSFATITFIGRAISTTLLTSGSADGFGIRLRDRYGDILTFGKPASGYELSSRNNVLDFTASLVPIKDNISAGEFYAVARLLMSYN